MGGSGEQILAPLSIRGKAVQIAPPPPAITDDVGVNFGGDGGQVIGPEPPLPADFGGGIEAPLPMDPEGSPTSPSRAIAGARSGTRRQAGRAALLAAGRQPGHEPCAPGQDDSGAE